MRAQSMDTPEKIEKVLIALIKQQSTANKINQIASLSRITMELSKRAILRNNNKLNEYQINLLFIKYHYGEEIAKKVEDYLKQKKHENT